MAHDDPTDPRPHSRLTLRVRRDVFADRAAFRLVTSRAQRPDDEMLARVDKEVGEALVLFDERGWLDAPETYHETPTPIEGARTVDRRAGRIRYTAMSWVDGYAPRPEEPGAERFLAYPQNGIARASLLQHRSGDRPWLVCVHGFGMGQPGLDLRAFRALHLHRALGLNLAFLTLPFHGRRNPGGARSSPPLPSADVLDTVHGLSQAVWDVRQLLAHLRARSDRLVGLMGLSLGGLVSGIVASVDEPHAALLLIPAVDLPNLAADAIEHAGIKAPGDAEPMRAAEPLFGPVSPLKLTPKVPWDRRFIVAGTLDHFARPTSQAVALWRHWDEPALHWYHGGHVSMFWARGVQDAIDNTLRATGLA